MHKKISFIIIVISLLSAGCSSAVNKELSPLGDTKWVRLEIKNPSSYTKPIPLEVRYISRECKKKRVSGFDGSVITEPSYNVTQIPLQQKFSDVWEAQVAISGGGVCNWKLSAINFGIKYNDTSHLGNNLSPGAAVGATVAFDNDASRNGAYYATQGNKLNYAPIYYPLIKRWGDQKYPSMGNKLYLFGEKKSFWEVRMNSSENNDVLISYNPVVIENKKVEMIFPYEKKDGATFTFVYPNGERVSSKEVKPDFKKLEMME